MQKKKNGKKWFLLGLIPLVGAISWVVDRLRKRPIPRKRALAPVEGTRLPFENPPPAGIAITGAAPGLVKDQPLPGNFQAGRWVEEADQKRQPGWQQDKNRLPDPSKTVRGRTDVVGPPVDHAARHHGETSVQADLPGEDLRAGHALENNTAEHISFYALLVPFVIFAVAIGLLTRYQTPKQAQVVVPGGDVERGRAALQSWGCGSCHTIPGVVGAEGKVGPNLEEVGSHSFVAGHLENTPDNMILWIMNPQKVSPGSGMPDTGVPEGLARDMAAYLYSLSNGERPGTGVNSFQIRR